MATPPLFSTPPPSLSADRIGYYDAQNQSLGLAKNSALRQQTQGTLTANQGFRNNLNSLGWQRNQAEYSMLGQLGDRGLATDPMTAGQGVADLNTQVTLDRDQALTDKTSRLMALQEMVQQAQDSQVVGQSLLNAQKASEIAAKAGHIDYAMGN